MQEQHSKENKNDRTISESDKSGTSDSNGKSKNDFRADFRIALIAIGIAIFGYILISITGVHAETIACAIPAYACSLNNTSGIMDCPSVSINCSFNATNTTLMEENIKSNITAIINSINTNFTNCTRTEAERQICNDKTAQITALTGDKNALQTSLNNCIIDVNKYKNESLECNQTMNSKISGYMTAADNVKSEYTNYIIVALIVGAAGYHLFTKRKKPEDELENRIGKRKLGDG